MNVSDCAPGQKCFYAACVDVPSAPDADSDTVSDTEDNCPDISNWTQADLDGDGQGDVCDADIDGDGFEDIVDNCPLIANPDQTDLDGNGWGDACEGGAGITGRTCSTLGYSMATQFFDGFEDGIFLGWFVPDGTSGSSTPGYIVDYVAPQILDTAAHGGTLGVHFPSATYGEANHSMEQEFCMPLTSEVQLSVWIKPDKVGYCCGPYGTAGFQVSFVKGTQGYSLSYLWSFSSQEDSAKHHIVHLDESPYDWTQGQWNHLEVNLQAALIDAFGFEDTSNVIVVKVKAYNHYSNGSPQGFNLDDLQLTPQ